MHPLGGIVPAVGLLLLLSRPRVLLSRHLRPGGPQPPALWTPAGPLHTGPAGGAVPGLPAAEAGHR